LFVTLNKLTKALGIGRGDKGNAFFGKKDRGIFHGEVRWPRKSGKRIFFR
jgi:hypothetical protein